MRSQSGPLTHARDGKSTGGIHGLSTVAGKHPVRFGRARSLRRGRCNSYRYPFPTAGCVRSPRALRPTTSHGGSEASRGRLAAEVTGLIIRLSRKGHRWFKSSPRNQLDGTHRQGLDSSIARDHAANLRPAGPARSGMNNPGRARGNLVTWRNGLRTRLISETK